MPLAASPARSRRKGLADRDLGGSRKIRGVPWTPAREGTEGAAAFARERTGSRQDDPIMHIVTGAAGFVGSNLVRALNLKGVREILAVDDLSCGDKFRNLRDCDVADYMDRAEFREFVRRGGSPGWKPAAVLHQGACADTTESDGRYMMDNNYTYSKELLRWALDAGVPFVYASSASVYGMSRRCAETPDHEGPLNVYAYSKLLFDNHVRRLMPRLRTTVVGLRYFNVYGPGEAHKGRMASMVWQLFHQLEATGVATLFEGTDGYGPGDQRRDFVFVGDVADINVSFASGPTCQGIFNVGTGKSRSFNEIARIIIGLLGRGEIRYIPFPESLRGKYQSFTEADVTRLRGAYGHPMTSLEDGIRRLAERAGQGKEQEAA
jgi:ADP-L-glycero-D-manno-heptose 6-epimerase